MNVLAFDTCMGAVSVALAHGEGDSVRIAGLYEERQTGHAERLFPMIEEVLAQAGTTIADVARVAVTVGPGTFTGIRTGVAAARGLTLASGCEVVASTSLEVMAAGADRMVGTGRRSHPMAVAVDARRGQVFMQLFGPSACTALSKPQLLCVAEAASVLPAAVFLVGSGAPLLADAARALGKSVHVALEKLEPDAADLARLAPSLTPLAKVSPLYIRPPDAKPPANPSLRA